MLNESMEWVRQRRGAHFNRSHEGQMAEAGNLRLMEWEGGASRLPWETGVDFRERSRLRLKKKDDEFHFVQKFKELLRCL